MLLLDLVMGNYKQNSIESRFAIRCVYDILLEDWKSNLYHKGLYFEFRYDDITKKEVPFVFIGEHWYEYEGTVPPLDDLNIVQKLFDTYVGELKND